MKRSMSSPRGFTLLEVLLVVGAISVLASIVILAINPNKQIGETRNAQRRVDVNTILNGVYQHAVDNGNMVATITTTTTEICRSDAVSCVGLIDLSALTASGTYLVAMPKDPSTATTNGTGYTIVKSTNGRVTVNAPGAELSAVITVTR